jgi:hypothetical protein
MTLFNWLSEETAQAFGYATPPHAFGVQTWVSHTIAQ